jgi:hypothetical protein
MQETKTKLQNLGFTSGHIQLLTVAFFVLGALIVFKSGINVTAMFAKADTEKPQVTYEQVKAEVESEYAQQNPSATSTDDQAQLALLDRGEIDGQVLGDAIGIGAIPDADQLPLPEITSQIFVKQFKYDDQDARVYYQNEIQKIESDSNVVSLLAGLNSSDKPTLDKAVQGWEWVINDLSQVEVPASLVEYHKTKLTYYSVMMNIGKIYAGQKSESDLQLLTKAMLSYSQKIESMTASVNQTYQLNI